MKIEKNEIESYDYAQNEDEFGVSTKVEDELDRKLVEEYKKNFNPDIAKCRLQTAIRYSGLSREDIKRESDVSTSMISNYLNSRDVIPSLSTLSRLSVILGVNFTWLIGKEDADIEERNHNIIFPPSNMVRLRRTKLAQMLAVHFHKTSDSISSISKLIYELENLDKQQINQLAIIARGIKQSDAQNKHFYNLSRVKYTAYPSNPNDPIPAQYDDLFLLNDLTRIFKPKNLHKQEFTMVSDRDIDILVRTIQEAKDDPETYFDVSLFTETLQDRIQFKEKRNDSIRSMRDRILEKKNKRIASK